MRSDGNMAMRRFIAASAVAVLTACSTDSYESGAGGLSFTTADFAEIYTDGAAAVSRVVTDDGETLAFDAPVSASWIDRPDTVYRALIYYDRMPDATVTPVGLTAVPVLRPVPSADLEEVHTDPVRFESLWTSAGGRYLNIGLYLRNGVPAGDDDRHTLGMMTDGVVRNADGTTTALLRMYHDQGGMPEYYSSRYYVSIPGGSIGTDSAAVTIVTYDGIVERRVRLR